MKTIKKQLYPFGFVSLIFIINGSLWLYFGTQAYLTSNVIRTSLMGSSLLMGFLIVFLLATRQRWIVSIFGGLENVYIWHRILAIFTTAFIFVHAYYATARGLINIPEILIIGRANQAGELARNIFIGLILIALLAKYMKYEHFRFIHRLLIIPYLIALYHGFFTSVLDLFSFNLLSVWMIFTSIIGVGSSFYMILIYQRTAFSHHGTIVEKKKLNDYIFELKIKTKRPYHFKPGQFAFIKINAKGFSKEPHPFSISGDDGEHIFFTIKGLGDFTSQIFQHLNTPTKIKITSPFGSMTFTSKRKQIWVAGGIGITPFLGYLRTHSSIEQKIQLVYSVNKYDEAVHLDTIQSLANENEHLDFTLHNTAKDGFINIKSLSVNDDNILYMCGPRPMVLALKKQMKVNHPKVPIVYEAFSFTGTLVEDIIRYLKIIYRKIKKA